MAAGDLKGQIEIAVDATGVEAGIGRAKRSLADLGATAKAAGQQASQGLASAGSGGDAAAATVDRATKNIAASIERATAALNAGGRATSGYFATLAAQKGANADFLKPLLADLDAANAKSANAAHGMDGLSFATAGAKRELLVLVHELSQGNFSRFGGSLLVLGERTGAASLLFSGMAISVGAAAAVLGGFAVAAALGAAESKALADALILTGDASGATYSGLSNAAKGIAAIAGSRGAAAEALTAIASTGAVAGENLEKFGLVAVKLSRDVGTSIEDTAKQFSELGRAPVTASEKLNESLHYLTLSTYEQIKGLQDQGKEAEAASAAQNAYADAMLSRTAQIEGSLGLVSRAWHAVGDAAKSAWDKMLNIGRADSLDDQLTKVGAQIDKARSRPSDTSAFGGIEDARAQAHLRDNLAVQSSLSRQLLLQDNVATSAKAAADSVTARVGFDKLVEGSLDRQAQKQREIDKARNLGTAAGASTGEIQKAVDAINEKYKDPKAAAPRNTDRASVKSDVDAIKAAESARLDAYKDAETIFSALRSQGLLSDQAYYAQEKNFIEQDAAVRTKAIDDQIAAEKRKTFTGPSAANNDLARQGTLAKLEADRAKVRQDADKKETLLSLDKAAALRALASAQLTADLAAERAFEQTQKQYDLDLAAARMGPQEAAQYSGRIQIANKYASDLQALNDKRAVQEKAGTFNDKEQSDYAADLTRIQTFQQKSLSSYDDYYSARKQQDADYSVGLDRATATYIENSQNVAKLTENAYTSTFSSLEDALTTFVTTGKLNFKSLADSIIADFVRIEVKQQESKLLAAFSSNAGGIGSSYSGGFMSLLGGIAGLFTGGGYSANGGIGYANAAGISGGRAAGGPVDSGKLYQVNERGPELLQSGGKQYLMMGSQSGNVVPNGGGAPTIINQTTGRVDKATVVQTGPNPEDRAILLQEAEQHIARQLYDPNSKVSQAMRRNVKAERVR